MFRELWTVLLLLLFTFAGVAGLSLLPDRSVHMADACAVPSTYSEALREDTGTLKRVLAMIGTRTSSIQEAGAARIYHRLLLSMRHYHEDQRAALPDCAHLVNTRIVETIAAGQDVLALMLVDGMVASGSLGLLFAR